MKKILLLFCLLTVVCLPLLSACKGKEKQMKRPAVPVTTEVIAQRPVPVQLTAIGNVEAYSTVSIKARVGGELMRVYFKEGQDVKKGDLLFAIDPSTYKTAFESSKANLMRDAALSKKADEDVTRYIELYKEQLVSKSQYDQIVANADALKATVEADKSAMENARLQLSYCSISAPLSGRTGSLLVDQGNLIRANDDKPMVVINQIQPVYVSFSVPEKNFPEIKKHMTAGKIKVDAYVSKDDKNPEAGILTFIDNSVDAGTGTIRLKGLFENKEKRLWPGQFITVKITLTTIQDAVVVPTNAIQTGQQGQFVFVIKDDTAEIRPVTSGVSYENMTVIEKGLSAGEQIVTDGQMLLMPGAKVEIRKPQDQKNINQNNVPKTENSAKDKAK